MLSLVGCASNSRNTLLNMGQTETAQLEGFWELPDNTTILEFGECEVGESEMCGQIVAFYGDPYKRDYQNSDVFKAGQRVCGTTVALNLKWDSSEPIFKGNYYSLADGQYYNLALASNQNDVLLAQVYMGTTPDEVIDVAIDTALSGPLSLFDGLALATRATLGRDVLTNTTAWERVQEPRVRCDRPKIKTAWRQK